MSGTDRIFGFWTGDNPMPETRQRCWQSFGLTGLRPTLVTPTNLQHWVVANHPLHNAYEYLSAVHRSDYLRGYFMYHHGGGYADIKRQTGSWLPTIERLNRSSRLMGVGYREIRGGTVWLQDNRVEGRVYVVSRSVPTLAASMVTNAMRAARPLLIGNCAYYFKPGTLFAKLWLKEAERRLDMLTSNLRTNPAREPRDRLGYPSGYPVPWSFLLGDIFHPLATIFIPFLSRGLPRPSFEDYL